MWRWVFDLKTCWSCGRLSLALWRSRSCAPANFSEECSLKLPSSLACWQRAATMAPPSNVESTGFYFLDHIPAQPDPNAPAVILNIVTPGTFAALGIPLKNGRDFDDSDTF